MRRAQYAITESNLWVSGKRAAPLWAVSGCLGLWRRRAPMLRVRRVEQPPDHGERIDIDVTRAMDDDAAGIDDEEHRQIRRRDAIRERVLGIERDRIRDPELVRVRGDIFRPLARVDADHDQP